MWSNLNDSFSALTGSINANISNLRQSIPSAFVEQENDEDKIRQLEIKNNLIQEEVFRHRDIALLYKDRWLTAQEKLKSSGIQCKDYNDEIDLLNDEHQKPESAQSQLPKTVSTSPISPTDLTALSEISLADDEESTIDEPVGEHSRPPSVSDLALNSAAKEIQRLEGELKKVNVDRDHWKTLAKQKSNVQEELDEARFQIVNYSTELKKCQLTLEETLLAKSELEVELQELDAQHETAIAKVIAMRDEALQKLKSVESSSQHDRGSAPSSSDGAVTVQQRDSATIIDAASNDNAEDGKKLLTADAIDASSSKVASRLRTLAQLDDDGLQEQRPLSAVIDQIAAKLSIQKDLEMRLEFLAGSNRDLEAKMVSIQEEAERKLKRQDELLEEVELMNEQLTEEVEALKSASQTVPVAIVVKPKFVEQSMQTTEDVGLQKDEEIATLKSEIENYLQQVEQTNRLLASTTEQARVLASKDEMIFGNQEKLRNLEEEHHLLLEQLQAVKVEHCKTVEMKDATIAKLGESATQLEEQMKKVQSECKQLQAKFDLVVEQLKKTEAEHLQILEAKELKIEELEHSLENVQSSTAQVEAATLPTEHREEPDGAEPESVEVGLKMNEEVQAELEGLIAEKDALRQSLVQVEEEVLQCKKTNGQLEDHLKQLLEERNLLMKRLEELENSQNELGRLQGVYQQLLEQFEVLSQEHKASVNEVASVRADLASRASSCEKDTEELLQLRDAVKRMSMLVQDKDQEVRELREKTAHLEAQASMAEMRESEAERLKTELERLRVHMITVEDNYTAELMASEQKIEEMATLLAKLQKDLEEGDKFSEQVKTLKTARDKARNELSALEDKVQSYSTSIANLQAVIGQLEKEHERKVRSLQADHQQALEAERNQTAAVMRKLAAQEERLGETLEALEAASRLSETIDAKEFTISQLKREVSLKCTEITALQRKIEDLKTSYEGKIDKQIVKSLLISFFATTHGTQARTEAERLLARFLDFNQQEMERSGIKIGRSAKANDSFTSMFVEFLETESKKEQDPKRKDSASAPSGSVELARDLNKRLAADAQPLSASARSSSINPFVSHPSVSSSSVSLGHHRTPSSASTGSSTSLEHGAGNALFSGVAGTAASVLLSSSSASAQRSSSGANIAQIVRDAVEKEDEVI